MKAKKLKRTRWLAPEDVDEEEWAENFKEAIKEREEWVRWQLNRRETRLDMQWYLNQQYMEDAINDEFEKDKDIFDDIQATV